MAHFYIRKVNPQNEQEVNRLYEICLKTGDSGADGTHLYRDPMLIGTVYAGQYAKFSPEYAFVIVDEHEQVHGYCVGVPDTSSFEKLLDKEWWPLAQKKYPLEEYPEESVTDSYKDPLLVKTIHQTTPENPEYYSTHPAHFHIDLLPSAQGTGMGRKLLTALLDEFRAHAVPAVHLGVGKANEGAVAFYKKMGFKTLLEHEWGYTMGMDLQA